MKELPDEAMADHRPYLVSSVRSPDKRPVISLDENVGEVRFPVAGGGRIVVSLTHDYRQGVIQIKGLDGRLEISPEVSNAIKVKLRQGPAWPNEED